MISDKELSAATVPGNIGAITRGRGMRACSLGFPPRLYKATKRRRQGMDNHSTPIDPSIGGGRVEHIGDHVLRHRYSTSLVDVTSPEQKRCTPPALGSGVWQEDVHLTISHHGKKAEVDGCPR